MMMLWNIDNVSAQEYVCAWCACVCRLCKLFDNVANYTMRAAAAPPAGCFTQARISGGERRVIGKNKRFWCWAHLQIYTHSLCAAHAHTKAENMTRNSAQGSRHFQFAASPSPDKSVIWESWAAAAAATATKRNNKHFFRIHTGKASDDAARWNRLIRCRFRRQRTRLEITVRSSGNPNCMRHFDAIFLQLLFRSSFYAKLDTQKLTQQQLFPAIQITNIFTNFEQNTKTYTTKFYQNDQWKNSKLP